ncbi:PAS domain S-box protein [Kutzneria viridogrisea]|uniref:protein-glutamate O-methyltransferase n=2 Tax=Kutzneria TaxID=43356 RepID=W5W2L5_9PSEU|nr:CheR family methyltransferase [Kutzneria albida]AHH94726.1 MCP methyltransferase, CheR-type with PAS/PAC sensor [Kutzneria albida DSM 43870]MBA8930395.1 two-component system CheB/CheR fusion protein [Kutzneria viridogrisea]
MTTSSGEPANSELESLLHFIRDARGFDFTGYKRSSLERRIRKRMQEVSIREFTDYRDLLEASAEEFGQLFNTILINVTSFVRDSDTWSFLQHEVLPVLLADAGEEIRVWSAGCSSGQEAYSLAIVFAEALGVEECAKRVKIYGTDVDEDALASARAGVYPEKALSPLTPELRNKYFEPNGSRFVFRPDLRRKVIFGRHDITRDAPISRLDLLTCRNTLMYFNVETQKQIVDRFHFALRENAYLFLGKAEMLLADGERFEITSMRRRVFKRRGGRSTSGSAMPIRFEGAMGTEAANASRRRLLRDLALDALPHAMIVLDENENAALINSQARTQFGLSAQDVGRPLRDLEVSYRPTELRSVVEQVRSERRTIRLTAVEHPHGGNEVQYLDIVLQPLASTNDKSMGAAITFIDVTYTTRLQQDLKQYREDLETAYEELQSTNEELETTNEELQSSIEELETTNEELQSTNEELETTNEELQSGNEELETMNEEMRTRTAELEEAWAFLEGVLASIAVGVVVLDRDGRVRSWNQTAQELWGLRAAEVQQQDFFALDIGLPAEKLHTTIEDCLTQNKPMPAVRIDAVNRRGQRITCLVSCSPLNSEQGGIVLLMEEIHDR